MSQERPPVQDNRADRLPGQTPLPEWLRQMIGWEDAPQWLLQMIRDSESQAPPAEPDLEEHEHPAAAPAAPAAPAEPAALEVPAVAGEEPPADQVPDWLSRMDGRETPAFDWSASGKEGDLPDWLANLSGVAEASASGQEVELPSWLQDTDDRAAPKPQAPAPEEPPLETEITDWFAGIDLSAAHGGDTEGTPERTEDMAEPEQPQGVQEAPEQEEEKEEEGIPAWLAALDMEEPGTQGAPGTQGVPEEPGAGAFEWSEGPAEPFQEEPEQPQGVQEAPEEEEEGIPAWLAALDVEEPGPQGAPEDQGAPEEPGEGALEWPEGAAEPAQEAPEQPQGIQEAPEQPQGIQEAPEEAEEGIPDWLAALDMQEPGPQGAPEWLATLDSKETVVEQAAGAEVQPPEAAPPAEEEKEPDWLAGLEVEEPGTQEEVPDWLSGAQEPAQVGAPTLGAPEEIEPEGEIPDWLRTLSETPAAAEPEPAPEPGEQEAAIPDWLAKLTTSPLPELEATAEEVAGDQGETDWLADLGGIPSVEQPPRAKGVTDWLRSVESMPVPEETYQEEPEEETEAPPEWLTASRPIHEPGPARQAAEEPAEVDLELPEWLQESGMERGAPQEEAPQPKGVTPEPAPLLPEEQPSLAEAKPPEAPAWMADMYTSPESEEEADVFAITSEGLFADVAKDALAGEEQGIGAEIPKWIKEMRPREALEPQEELPVETSGPLAGLAGLLNPEPLLGIFPRSTYKPTPPVPEAHLAEVEVIEQILAAPTSGPVGRLAKEKTASQQVLVGFGRWIIYAAMLVAAIAAAFIPGLENWIRPPDTPEATSFYNVVSQQSAGSQALLVLDYDASLDGELTPQLRAVLWHLLQRDLKVITVSLTPQGTAIARDLFASQALNLQEAGYRSGEHYVDLGYLPPNPASLHAFIAHPLAGVTYWETAAAQTPLGQQVAQFSDLDMIVTVSGSEEHVRWWIEQVGSQTDVDILAGVSASVAPYLMPYYGDTPGSQLRGMLVGLTGAAQYEALSGAQFTPNARENLLLQGSVQFVFLIIVLLGAVRSLAKGK